MVAITIVAATNLLIIRAGEAHVAASVGEVPKSQAAIILGAKVFEDNILSNVLADRCENTRSPKESRPEIYSWTTLGSILKIACTARDVFEVERAVVVTERFHLARSV